MITIHDDANNIKIVTPYAEFIFDDVDDMCNMLSKAERLKYDHHNDTLDAMRYCYNDILVTKGYNNLANGLKIKKVIYNDPATIVCWTDGTKTIVKCSEDDYYDEEKGLAMAICKKYLGDKQYKDIFKEFSNDKPAPIEPCTVESAIKGLANLSTTLNKISTLNTASNIAKKG